MLLNLKSSKYHMGSDYSRYNFEHAGIRKNYELNMSEYEWKRIGMLEFEQAEFLGTSQARDMPGGRPLFCDLQQ
jgi:hypothetical protein